MARRLTERQIAVVFVVVLIASITSLYAFAQRFQPAPAASSLVHRATLLVETPAWTIRYEPEETANGTAFSILVEASHRLGFEVRWIDYSTPPGAFVISVNGTTNGQGGRFWQYWVDGVYGSVAADRLALQDGASVLWRFAAPQEA